MYIILFSNILVWLLGYQVYNKDLVLLSGRYHYRFGAAQFISYVAIVLLSLISCFQIPSFSSAIWQLVAGLFIAFFLEWIISRINPSKTYYTLALRLGYVLLLSLVLSFTYYTTPLLFGVMGWYVRNIRFGGPHKNTLIIAKYLRRKPQQYHHTSASVSIPPEMPDFSNAGNHREDQPTTKQYDVTEYGILPDTKEDLIEKVQALINEVGERGGGTIFFPKGRYLFNKSGRKEFLQINYSNITIEGEIGSGNSLLTELVNCGNTVNGEKNPWLSPFFITTGETLQGSNVFFGLQFRKKKSLVMRSDSMSDPGSDGDILTPPFATKVTKSSNKGETILYVENASSIGKYIMLGLYNTDKEASLLKDILGQDVIRPEWQAAMRAGEEEAPSFQWLVEVQAILDEHTIELVQPLWRDCDIRYEPAIFNVPMLESIVIKDLKLSSSWNGMFKHHGQKYYYRRSQAQEMDYGWNGINMKRVAHGAVQNVILDNFTNPLYVLDSRNVTCEHITIKGNDGHQGIKIYEHACENLFRDIRFYNHYSDMMGGEGNAYGNVFSDVWYMNPCFNPVNFDFHGFSEGPMSPPSYNLFENVHGFSYIESGGSLHMKPSCARANVFWNCYHEGEKKRSFLFKQNYHPKITLKDLILISIASFKKVLKHRIKTPSGILLTFKDEKEHFSQKFIMSYTDISQFYTDFYLYGLHSSFDLSLLDSGRVHISSENRTCIPESIV